jgi:hypothetical protein
VILLIKGGEFMNSNQNVHHPINHLDQETMEIYTIAYGLDNKYMTYESEYAFAYEYPKTQIDIQIRL